MTQKEFDLLNREQQENTLTENGEFLMVKTIDGDKFGLYSVGKFFVEIRCDADSLRVKEVKSFVSGQLLDRYTGH